MKILAVSVIFLMILVTINVTGLNIEKNNVEIKSQSTEFAPGEVIIGFYKDEIEQQEYGILNAEENLIKVSDINEFEGRNIKSKIEDLNIAVLDVEKGTEQDFINYVTSTNCPSKNKVKYAELNYKRYLHDFPYDPPNDELYKDQWNLYDDLYQHINARRAWPYEVRPSSTKVAIIDSGVSLHPDLKNNIKRRYSVFEDDSDLSDIQGHGTNCAGIVAAEINNGIGIAGIAQAKIYSVRVAKIEGGESVIYVSNTIKGIKWAADQGVDIISMSLGSYNFSNAEQEVCNYAYNKGCLLVASAGNDNEDLSKKAHYPSGYSSVICVGGTDRSGDRYQSFFSGSNYGGNRNTDGIELVAPAISIYTTNKNGGYELMSGTSAAAPHVAGVAALVHSCKPSLSNIQIRQILRNSATKYGSDPSNEYGYGLVNAYGALDELLAMPNLKLDGRFDFGQVECGKDVKASIYIKNIGETGSDLYWGFNWEDVPDFGKNWQILDSSGYTIDRGNVGGGSSEKVYLQFRVEDKKDVTFSGSIKFYNRADPSDCEVVFISGSTVKLKGRGILSIFDGDVFFNRFFRFLTVFDFG